MERYEKLNSDLNNRNSDWNGYANIHVNKNNQVKIDVKEKRLEGKCGKDNFGKVMYALLYAASSFLMMYVNKIVLTVTEFPAPTVLFVGQALTTVILLKIGQKAGFIKVGRLTPEIGWKLQPLSIFYLLNATMGLGATKFLPLPMFTALRRFAILLTMLGEIFLFDTMKPFVVRLAVYIMIVGSYVAAVNDLTFNLIGYTMVMLNNLVTSANDLTVKLKLVNNQFGPYEILYYNAIISVIPAIFICILSGDFQRALTYERWTEWYFQLHFISSCLMGSILIWSMVQCIHHNTPLTTAIVGTTKNILVTYVGMFIGNDYIFDHNNFIGINLSVAGSLIYTIAIFRQQFRSSNKPN